jgi:hypothetical protein
VLENSKDCERDGVCLLRVRQGNSVWRVIYHPGEGERQCLREDVTRVGLAVKVGDTVTARGVRVADAPPEHSLDACISKSAHLQIVKPRPR